ncbi:unnamed protein product, partial [Urochloa humidicola]
GTRTSFWSDGGLVFAGRSGGDDSDGYLYADVTMRAEG